MYQSQSKTKIQGGLGIGEHCRYRIRIPDIARNLETLTLKVKNLAPFYTSFLPNLGPLALFASVWDGNDMICGESVKSRIELDRKENYNLWINSADTWKLNLKGLPNNLILELISEISYKEDALVPFEVTISHPSVTIEEEAILYKEMPITKSKIHLVVFSHGMGGNILNFKVMGEMLLSLNNEQKDYNIHLLPVLSNQAHTLDGIDKGGKRVTESILEFLNYPNLEWIEKGSKISFIGHSLGGLYNRYCIGDLNLIKFGSLNFFDILQPENYIAFATPHLGSWETPLAIDLSLKLGIFKKTGKDLLPNKSNTILELLSDPNQTFHQGLKKFKKLTSYANLANDDAVGFYSSSLMFIQFDKSIYLKLNPIKRNVLTSIIELYTKPPEASIIDPIIYDELSHSGTVDSYLTAKSFHTNNIPSKAITMVKNLHQDLQWRKVLTYFSYQPHSAMVARRRFQHFHGYPVIYHMLQKHSF